MRLKQYITEQRNIRVFIKKPTQCTPQEKETFLELVLSGDQNDPSYVKNTFPHLHWVGILYEDMEIRAVSSLKLGRNFEVFEMAGVGDMAKDYPFEVGFSYTSPTSRGRGFNKMLKKELFSKVGNKGIFCTVRVTNKASLAINKSLGFRPVGEPYEGLVVPVQLMVL